MQNKTTAEHNLREITGIMEKWKAKIKKADQEAQEAILQHDIAFQKYLKAKKVLLNIKNS